MAITNFIPQLWSARLQARIASEAVIAPLCNTNWEGEVRSIGGSLRILMPGPISVHPYVPNTTTVAYEVPSSVPRTLTLDQVQYYAFRVDDVNEVQSKVKQLLDQFVQPAAFAIVDAIDAFLASQHTAAGLADIPITLATTDMYDAMVTAAQRLNDQRIPRSGRWVVVSPAGYARIQRDTRFIHATQRGDAVIATGLVGSIAGFDVHLSTNLQTVAGPPIRRRFLYGTNAAITHAHQLLGEPEALRLPTQFGDAIRGLVVYGAAVVQPLALGTISADEG